MKLYSRFKKRVEQKKIQGMLGKFTVLGIVIFFAVLLAILVTNDTALSRVLGLATQATPTPSPIPTVVPLPTLTPTPTNAPQVKGQAVQRETVIDCVGADGGHLRITQKECDDFNAAWKNKPSTNTQTQTTSLPQQPKSVGNNFYCYDNAYKYSYYTTSGDKCNADNVKSIAVRICYDTQQLKSNTCSAACARESDNAKAVCLWAYTGENAGVEQNSDLYGECLNGPDGSSERYGSCLSKCTDQYAIDIKQCN